MLLVVNTFNILGTSSVASKGYAKLFYNLSAAEAFGEEVDFIATTDRAKVSYRDGKNKNTKSIFVDKFSAPNAEAVSNYHVIEKDQGSSSDIYYVKYTAQSPRGSSRADFELAKRHTESYLNTKYEELGPDTGIVYS